MTDRSFLIDTHIFIWWISDKRRIKALARFAMEDTRSEIYVSAAVTWEIAIKAATGKLKTVDDPAQYILNSGFIPLPISHAHAQAVGQLPPIHHDPFDRIQLAQASHNGLTFITADKINLSYPHIAMMEGA